MYIVKSNTPWPEERADSISPVNCIRHCYRVDSGGRRIIILGEVGRVFVLQDISKLLCECQED